MAEIVIPFATGVPRRVSRNANAACAAGVECRAIARGAEEVNRHRRENLERQRSRRDAVVGPRLEQPRRATMATAADLPVRWN